MIHKYGYKQQIITNLNNIDTNSNNFYNYKGLNFLSKLNSENENLVIIFHGAVSGNGIDRIIFRGHDYNIDNTNIVCISDYLLNKYHKYKVNWALSTVNYNAEQFYIELFTYIINLKKYNKVIFTGTSAGGFPSLKFACKFNSIALIANSQIYLEEYGKSKIKNYGFEDLKNIVEKNNDKLIYKNKQIEYILQKNKPKKVIIYNNKKDSTFINDIQPLIKYIENIKISNLFEMNLFEYDGIIPTHKTHHHIQFPDNNRHIQILQQLLKK